MRLEHWMRTELNERIKHARLVARLDDDNLRRRLIRAYDQNWNGGTDRLMDDVENAKEAE